MIVIGLTMSLKTNPLLDVRQSMLRRLCYVMAICCGLALLPTGNAFATLPVVTKITPCGIVRGQETVITLAGSRLDDAHQVLCDLPGIEILEVKPIGGNKVEVKLRTDSNLTPGLYPIRLVTKSGIANLRLLGVGQIPVVNEVEPNNDFAAPQKIDLNCTIEGVVTREDIDYFQVALKAGQTLNVEVDGLRLAYSLNNQNILDPYIAILDEGRFEVASSDDSALLQQDGYCTFKAPKDGVYTVMIRDSSFLGSAVGLYRLHIGDYPRPLAVFPAGGQPSSQLKAKLLMADGSEQETTFELPADNTYLHGLATQTASGVSPSPNWVRVNELPVALEQEPNDDRRKAPVVPVPGAYCGMIEKPGDFDCFSFECKKGTRYRVEVFARHSLRSPLDPVINVYNPKAATLVSGDDSGGKIDPAVEFTAAEDGKHTVRIYDHLRGGSRLHQYRIEVTMPQPHVKLTLKQLRRNETERTAVPVGGSMAIVVTAARDRYNGEVNLSLDGLPEGVTATTFPMPPGRPEVPVLLTAAADAKHNASLYSMTAKGDEKSPLVGGRLSQTHNLVLGQNQRAMFTHRTERAAAAVTDAAPFTIEMVQPKTPIVRNGSKSLIVRIKKNAGFDERVTLRTLYNPPGVAINNSRYIDKGKTEAAIPITANGGAGIGTWPLILLATYNSSTGQAQIATNPIMLEVQDSLFAYTFPKSAGELDTEVTVAVPLTINRDPPGAAEAELVGLPAGVTSDAVKQPIPAGAESVSFPLKIAKDARVGLHKTLSIRTRVTVGDEVIMQTNGVGELRIDKPLPPKVEKPKEEKPKPKAAPKPAAPKPLSRLEQLRQMKKQE